MFGDLEASIAFGSLMEAYMKRFSLFRFKSIRTVLVLPFIVSFFLATALITAVIFNDSQRALNSVLMELRKTMISLVQQDLDYRLNEVLQLIHTNKDAFETGLLPIDRTMERERYLTMMLRNYPDVVMAYIALPDGQFYGARRNPDGTLNVVRNNQSTGGNSLIYSVKPSGEGDLHVETLADYDPRKRSWYIKALETKEITFNPIYSHIIFKEPTLTACLPIYEGGMLQGVLGVEYLMTWLGGTLGNLPIGDHGLVFIVDENRQLVATSSGEKVFQSRNNASFLIPAAESPNPVIRKVMEASAETAEGGSNTFEILGKSYLYGDDLYQQRGLTWHIYTVIERNNILSEMNRTTLAALQTILALSAVFIIYAFVLSHQIVNPILEMNRSAKKLSAGQYEEVKGAHRRDELGQLTESFNDMGKQLTEMVNNLEEEVENRTAELEEKNAILSTLSYVDELAQIPNRRKFDEFFRQTLELSSRGKRPIGLMMLDIDNFKKFNDLYGHVAGDDCIRAVGNVLRESVHRASDLAARYGGEEFVVVLQETSQEGARAIAESLRTGIRQLNIRHEDSDWGFVTVSIGVVFGVAGIHQPASEIVNQADEALYQAKNSGRNAIVFSAIAPTPEASAAPETQEIPG